MNTSKTEGIFDEAKGKVKQGVGEVFNDQSLANSGAADQVKGHAEETWGNVKDSAHDAVNSSVADRTENKAENTAHNLRDNVTSAAEHVSDSVKRGLHNLEEKFKD